MTTLIIVKFIWGFIVLLFLLYMFDLGLRQIKETTEGAWFTVAIVMTILFILVILSQIAAYNSKIISFLDIIPMIYTSILIIVRICDPDDFLYDHIKEYMFFIVLLWSSVVFCIPMGVLEEKINHNMKVEVLSQNKFERAKIVSWNKCPNNSDHIHFSYKDRNGRIRDAIFYMEVNVDKIEDIDPNYFKDTYILSKEAKNEILYFKSTKNGKIKHPFIFYMTPELKAKIDKKLN